MKTNVLMFIALGVMMSLAVNAQPQRMQPYSGKSPQEARQVERKEGFSMPFTKNLDEKQRAELRKISMEGAKENLKTRNLLKEKRARLEVLQTADKPDMKEINKVIDEIAALQAQEMKAKAASRQKIRNLLTEEQRVHFDAFAANHDKQRLQQRAGAERFRQQRERGSEMPQRRPTR
jgi:Spy/CpxP family protein refolding chaperone